MAVPKKKNARTKYKYSMIKKEYLQTMINGILNCKLCNKYLYKKQCFNCIYILKKSKILRKKKNEE